MITVGGLRMVSLDAGWSLVGDLRVRSLNGYYRLFVQLLYFYSSLLGTTTNIFLKYTVCTYCNIPNCIGISKNNVLP
jgi:hypothetical protein